ncbi:hypothetical protein KEF85_04215 [Methylomonas paludis]|uniref:Exopolysaccharide biosynthesis operon protein EpsL n=1 Tax=Methylomonas paludis TaxID=1173101 RepID=A0A975RAV2_9GAMM|nr:hypothetical protein [Methylomonas paludis]QWF71689.1 hypothetical protein KEF85_04215 [Methylomonas paludis]
MNKYIPLTGGLLFCLQLTNPGLAVAGERDYFQPYIYEKSYFDSNLLLLPDKNNRAYTWSGASRSDIVNQLTLGTKLDYAYKRQKIHADFSVRDNRYANNQPLNYLGTDDKLSMEWRAGKHLYGEMGYGYQQVLDSFIYYQTPLKNIITFNNAYFDAKYTWHPRWTLKGGMEFMDSANSNEQRVSFDRQIAKTVISLNYLIGTNYTQTIEYTSSYVNNVNRRPNYVTEAENKYTIDTIGIRSFWYLSPKKLHLITEISEAQLKNSHFSVRDFSDTIGRLTFKWDVNAKVHWSFMIWKNVYPSQGSYGSYVVSEGISPSLEWNAQNKLTFKAKYLNRHDNYTGPSFVQQTIGTASTRTDNVTQLQTEAIYAPNKNVEIGLTLTAENRHSSISDWSYTDYISAVNAKFTF